MRKADRKAKATVKGRQAKAKRRADRKGAGRDWRR